MEIAKNKILWYTGRSTPDAIGKPGRRGNNLIVVAPAPSCASGSGKEKQHEL